MLGIHGLPLNLIQINTEFEKQLKTRPHPLLSLKSSNYTLGRQRHLIDLALSSFLSSKICYPIRMLIHEDIEMDSETKSLLEINQRLYRIAKKSILSLIKKIKSDTSNTITHAEIILISYSYKSIDLFDGILLLQKCNLMENSQVLIRVLFETNLNFGAFIKLASETDNENAANKVRDAILIMKSRDAMAQDIYDRELQVTVDDIKRNYSDEDIKKIKKYGFTLCSIYQRAKNDNKIPEYNAMYRNFSRNVHSFDFIEYFQKTGMLSCKETYEEAHELRNQVALWHSHRCFFQIIAYMNKWFHLGIEGDLKTIQDDFSLINE